MKQRQKITIAATLILLVVACLYFLRYPCPPEGISKSTPLTMTPKYIPYLWPLPQSEVGMLCYLRSPKSTLSVRGISITIHPDSILELETFESKELQSKPFSERVYLYVDGKSISNDSRIVFDNLAGLNLIKNGEMLHTGLSSEYIISWQPMLSFGSHTAKVVIETRTGAFLEYEWNFAIK